MAGKSVSWRVQAKHLARLETGNAALLLEAAIRRALRMLECERTIGAGAIASGKLVALQATLPSDLVASVRAATGDGPKRLGRTFAAQAVAAFIAEADGQGWSLEEAARRYLGDGQ